MDAYYLELKVGETHHPGHQGPVYRDYISAIYIPSVGLLRAKLMWGISQDFSFTEASGLDVKLLEDGVNGRLTERDRIVNVKRLNLRDEVVAEIQRAGRTFEFERGILGTNVRPIFDEVKPILIHQGPTQ